MIKNTHDFEPIKGKYVNLREVEIEDSAFILSLRTDPERSRFLHKTENDLQKQIDYLKHYKTLDNEWYFIVEDKQHDPLGTLRIYDVKNATFTGGSWLMRKGVIPEESIECYMLMTKYAFEVLHFEKSVFDVCKNNKKVVQYHKLCGAEIVREDEENYYFEMTKEKSRKKIAFLDTI